MRIYQVMMTNPALLDLKEAADYLRKESPDTADQFAATVIAECKSLARLPLRFVKVADSRRGKFPIHRMIVHPYLVFYRIEADTIFILTVRHSKRRPLKRFD